MNRRTKTRLTIAIILIVLVPLGLIGWAGWRAMRGPTGRSVRASARDTVGFLITPKSRIKKELNVEIDKIKAAGEPLMLAEIAPAEVPDSGNAGLLYLRAGELLPPNDELETLTLFGSKPRAGKPKPPTEAEVEPILARSANLVSLVREASALTSSHYANDWATMHPEKLIFPINSKLRSLTRVMAAQMQVDGLRGDSREALRDTRAGIAIGESLGEEPLLISQLVRYACNAVILTRLRWVLSNSAPATEDCKALFDYVIRIDYDRGFRRALLGERAAGIGIFEETKQHPGAYVSKGLPSSSPKWMDADEVLYLRMASATITVADKPYRLIPNREDRSLSDYYPDGQRPFYAFITGVLVMAPGTEAGARDRAKVYQALALAALALRAYKNEKGAYPASLAELCKVIPWRLAEDPFSGGDLKYRRDKNGFLLYSVGQDLKDDNGLDFLRPIQQGAKRDNTGDIVWRVDK